MESFIIGVRYVGENVIEFEVGRFVFVFLGKVD